MFGVAKPNRWDYVVKTYNQGRNRSWVMRDESAFDEKYPASIQIMAAFQA